jgi:hypothetical protein
MALCGLQSEIQAVSDEYQLVYLLNVTDESPPLSLRKMKVSGKPRGWTPTPPH